MLARCSSHRRNNSLWQEQPLLPQMFTMKIQMLVKKVINIHWGSIDKINIINTSTENYHALMMPSKAQLH